MRLPRLCCLAACVCVAGALRAASFDARVELLLRPPLGEWMALSPDGLRFAYTTQAGGTLKLVLMSVEPPGPRRTVAVDPEHDPETALPASDAPPFRLRFLRWATPDRLVYAPAERIHPLPAVAGANGVAAPNPDGPAIVAPILAVDADGRQRGTLIDARDFLETSADARSMADLLRTPKEIKATRNEPVHWRMPHLDILGFLPGERDQLIIGTRGGFNPPAQYALDVRAGSTRGFGGNWPLPPDESQVFDWHRLKVVGERRVAGQPATLWRDDELGGVQRELESKFPRRVVELLDWSETRARVLFRVTGGRDPGRVFVFQRTENLVLEIMRTAPWLDARKLHETREFAVTAPDGARLTGYVTWPKAGRGARPPLLVVFPSGFPGRAQPAFDPEAELFAELGFVVARLNHRSVAGVKPGDLSALRTAVDRVSVDDARLAIEGLAGRGHGQAFDHERICALGRGFGGYLAVRALQLQPALFRTGIAIDAPMDLRPWLQPPAGGGGAAIVPPDRSLPAGLIDPDGADWRKLSVLEQAEALTNPVFLLVEPGRNAAVDTSTAGLRARLEGLGRSSGHLELDPGFAAARPEARAPVYRKIRDFLHQHLPAPAVGAEAGKEGK